LPSGWTAQPLEHGQSAHRPVLHDLARDHPPGADHACPLPAVMADCRGSALRAGHRHHARDCAVLVEPLWGDLRDRDPAEPGAGDALMSSIETGTSTRCLSRSRGCNSLLRTLDHEGEVLERVVTKRRDRKTASQVLSKSRKRHGHPETIVTDPPGVLRRRPENAARYRQPPKRAAGRTSEPRGTFRNQS
jgi:hypothetical protein